MGERNVNYAAAVTIICKHVFSFHLSLLFSVSLFNGFYLAHCTSFFFSFHFCLFDMLMILFHFVFLMCFYVSYLCKPLHVILAGTNKLT